MNSLRLSPCFVLVLLLLAGVGWWAMAAADDEPGEDEPVDFENSLERAVTLEREGNWAEALEIRRELLGKAGAGHPEQLGRVLQGAVSDLNELGRWPEVDELIEGSLERHPESLWLTISAARLYGGQLPDHGRLIDGEFRRAPSEGSGRWVNTWERDRIRSLQLWQQALDMLGEDEFNEAIRVEVWSGFARALLADGAGGSQAWRLTRLTDWNELPAWDKPVAGGFGDGWPVEADGSVWFPAKPDRFADCGSDGARWRWLIERAAAADLEVRLELVQTWRYWLGVHSLADGSWVPWSWGEMQEQDTRAEVLALHTLKPDETSLKTAVGPRRLQLPEFARFLPQLNALAGDEEANLLVRHLAVMGQVQELLNRRQFASAAEELAGWIEALNRDDLSDPSPSQSQKREARELWRDIVDPRGGLDPMPPQVPGNEVELSLVFRNASEVKFTARRVDTEALLADSIAYLEGKPDEVNWEKFQPKELVQGLVEENRERYLGEVEHEWTAALEPAPGHWDKRVSVPTPLAEAALWWIEADFGEEGSQVALPLEIVPTILTARTADHAGQLFLAAAGDGRPLAGYAVKAFGWQLDYDYRNNAPPLLNWSFRHLEGTSDEQGMVEFTRDQVGDDVGGWQWMLRVDGEDGTQWLGWSHWNLAISLEAREALRTQALFVTSDRPVYRPGDAVHLAAWARRASYDPEAEASPWAGERMQVTVQDARGEELFSESLEADLWGGVEFDLELEDEAALGQYSVSIRHLDGPAEERVAGSTRFRVEEYRKPEFTVEVEAPDEPVGLGERFEATVRADYLFGAPVREGTVKYTVTRVETDTSWYPPMPWDWLFGEGYAWRLNLPLWHPAARYCWCILPPARGPWSHWWVQPAPPEVIAQAEVPLGEDGTVQVPIDTSLAAELHGNRDHRYTIEAEVIDSSRRTVTGSSSVIAAREPFSVAVWTRASFYRPGRQIEVHVAARTPDGRPVEGQGTLRVLSEALDEAGELVETELESFDFATDADGDGLHDLSFPEAGQWRVEVELEPVVAPGEQPTTAPDGTGLADEVGGGDSGQDTPDSRQTGTTLITVRGPGAGDIGVAYEELTLAAERPEYAPGETIRVLVGSRFEDATVLVWVRPQNGVYPRPQLVELDGRTAEIELEASHADQPNLFLEAQLIQDAQIHRVVEQVFLPPLEQVAEVTITPDAADYLPREEATFNLRVVGPDGQPLAGRVIVTGYDQALEGIAGALSTPDLREFFWGTKRQHQPRYESNAERRWPPRFAADDREVIYQPLGVFGWSVGDEGPVRRFASRGFGGSSALIIAEGENVRANPFGRNEAFAFSASVDEELADGFVASASPNPLSAPLPEAQADGAPGVIEPVVRADFADSLLWQAFLDTDSDGLARFTATMPDDLTTWTVRAWVIGPDTEVGEAKAEILTRKEVMVRLATPRFLIESDEIVFTGIVHNETEGEQQLEVSLETEGGVLQQVAGAQATVEGGDSQPTGDGEDRGQGADVDADAEANADDHERDTRTTVTVSAHGEQSLEWRFRATAEGEATVRLSARGTTDSDAIERTFPVHVHGIERAESWSLALRADTASTELPFTLTDELTPGSQVLRVRWSPTLAGSMVEALPYLASYPHDSIDTQLHRFVPAVVTRKVLDDLGVDLETLAGQRGSLNAGQLDNAEERAERVGQLREDEMPKGWNPVFDPAELANMVSSGVKILAAQQRSDGGWSWFPGARDSSPSISAQVLAGLAAAVDAGTDVPEEVLQGAVDYLRAHELAEIRRLALPGNHSQHKHRADNLDAFVHHALERRRAGDERMRGFLYRDRLGLSPLNQTLLGLVCHERDEVEERDMILRNLRQFLEQDDENQTAWLALPTDARWWFWWNDKVETQAAFLRLLAAIEPGGELAARVAKYLVNNRVSGSHWRSNRDTATAVLALAEFVQESGEFSANLNYRILLDGEELAAGAVTGDSLFAQELAIDLEGDALPPGEHLLRFEREGDSPLYAAVWLEYFSCEDPIPAAGLEVEIERRYWHIMEERTEVDVADANAQNTSQDSLHERRVPLAEGDPLQSGDTIEVEFVIKSRNDYEYLVFTDHKPAGFEPVGLLSGWNWNSGIPYYQELRDEGAVVYLEKLPRGEHSISYRLRAEAPGEFSALPILGHALYAPEIRANSAEMKVGTQAGQPPASR